MFAHVSNKDYCVETYFRPVSPYKSVNLVSNWRTSKKSNFLVQAALVLSYLLNLEEFVNFFYMNGYNMCTCHIGTN